MVREKNEDRRWRMFARIREDLDATQDVGPWLGGLATLRDRLLVSDDETYFLAETFAEAAVFGMQRDPELDRIADAMKAIEAANGLRDDESYLVDEGPEDWRELNGAWDQRADEIMTESMRKAGLGDVATVFVENRAKFDERAAEGRHRILPPADDDPHFD
jgi:hypothetical protein